MFMAHKICRSPIVEVIERDGKLYEFHIYATSPREANMEVKSLPKNMRKDAIIVPKKYPEMRGTLYQVYVRHR